MDPLRRARVGRLGAVPFAHRGLHGSGRVENSLVAFAAAVEAGRGIELDVQLSRDGQAIVFHDHALERLTGETGLVGTRTALELGMIGYRGGAGVIPTLSDALRTVGGRVPLLIEIKAPDRRAGRLCAAVAQALDGYAGAVGIMSFNSEVGRWFRRHSAAMLRGLVVSENGKKGLRGRMERRLSLLRSGADFLAYDIRDLPSRFAAAAGLPVFTWTVRSEADRARAAAHADQIIYEGRAA